MADVFGLRVVAVYSFFGANPHVSPRIAEKCLDLVVADGIFRGAMAKVAIFPVPTNDGNTFIACTYPKITLVIFAKGAHVVIDDGVEVGWVVMVILERVGR